MNLKLNKPIAFFDLESTGLNVAHDCIIEISVIKINTDQSEETLTARIKPTCPISKEASEITGITEEDLKDCPTFKEFAPKLAKFLENCDLGGFNSNKFDVPLLVEEFLRAGVDFDMRKRKCIDVQVIYHKQEQRNLTAAYKFYCGKDLNNAHSAFGDTQATYEVLKAQLDKYSDLQNDVEFLSKYSAQTNNVDFAGRMIYNENGEEVFNFGKYKGKKVEDVLSKIDFTYYDWIMKNDFALNTKECLTHIKLRMAQNKLNGK
ncbi:MAG: 3'-5' exonuclease [Bacteroidales bacterium]|nr:3'-5' exonuclease [Bacteroidales bacterium]